MAKREIVLVLNDIRSLHNVGSFFRTADAFGVSKIYLCGITGTPESRSALKLTKVSLNAEKYINWEYLKNPIRHAADKIQKLKAEGYQIIALEQDKKSTPLARAKFKSKVALIIGNEIKGVSRAMLNLSDLIVEIPMQGLKESLNASVAGAIAIYEIRNKK